MGRRARVVDVRPDQRQRQAQPLRPDAADPRDHPHRDRRQRLAGRPVIVAGRTALQPWPPEPGHIHRHRPVPLALVRHPPARLLDVLAPGPQPAAPAPRPPAHPPPRPTPATSTRYPPTRPPLHQAPRPSAAHPRRTAGSDNPAMLTPGIPAPRVYSSRPLTSSHNRCPSPRFVPTGVRATTAHSPPIAR